MLILDLSPRMAAYILISPAAVCGHLTCKALKHIIPCLLCGAGILLLQLSDEVLAALLRTCTRTHAYTHVDLQHCSAKLYVCAICACLASVHAKLTHQHPQTTCHKQDNRQRVLHGKPLAHHLSQGHCSNKTLQITVTTNNKLPTEGCRASKRMLGCN